MVLDLVTACVRTQLGWCLGPRACRLCCASLPPASESTSTRLLYLLLLTAGTALMAAMLTPSLQHELQSAFKDFNATCIDLNISDNCMLLTGYMALYKVSFGISTFFLGLALLNIGVTSSSGVRGSVHNGFWAWKLLVLCLLCVTTFVIPVPHLDTFHTGWLYCALAGACVFLLVQMFLVTKVARSLSLPRPLAPPPSCSRQAASLVLALLLTITWLAATAWLFIRYTGPSCMSTNTIIVTCNAVLSLVVTSLTILPCTKKTTGGVVPALLQSAIVCCYLVWLTWVTVTSTPDTETDIDPAEEYFNHFRDRGIEIDLGPYHAGREPYHDLDIPRPPPGSPPATGHCGGEENPGPGVTIDLWVPYTAILILFILLAHNSVTSWSIGRPKQVGLKYQEEEDNSDPGLCICCRPTSRRQTLPGPSAVSLAEQEGGQHMIRNEMSGTVYSYSLYHGTLCLANMYITMQLTQWFQPQETTIISFSKSWSTVILKTVSTWLSVLVYLAMLVLPSWRPPVRSTAQTGSGQIPPDLWASEETACLQTSHI